MAVTSVGQHVRRTNSVRDTSRVPYRLSIETAGLATMLLGAWAGIVVFVGPIFGFSPDGTSSWTWSLAHTLLFLVPGAVAMLAGLTIIVEGVSRGRARRMLLSIGGLLAATCGAWLVVGPMAWPVLEGRPFFTGAVPLRELAYWIGCALGPGGLLLAFGAFVLGRPHASVSPAGRAPMSDSPDDWEILP